MGRSDGPTGGPRVLDIGGGPGRYVLWLAGLGHRVTLADLSPELLDIARARTAAAPEAVGTLIEADACDLARWEGASFDAALSLGPFYHLTDRQDRARAAAELARVLRPGGVAFVAVMPRYAFLRRTLAIPDERRRLADPAFVARMLDDGVFLNDVPGRFTSGYGMRPDEVAPFFARHGFATLALLSTTGVAFSSYRALWPISRRPTRRPIARPSMSSRAPRATPLSWGRATTCSTSVGDRRRRRRRAP